MISTTPRHDLDDALTECHFNQYFHVMEVTVEGGSWNTFSSVSHHPGSHRGSTWYHHPGSHHPESCHSGSHHPGSTVTSRSTNHRAHMKTSRGIYGYLMFTPGKRLHHLLSIQTVQLFGSIIIKVLGFCTFPLDCSAEPNLHGSMYLR